MKNLSAQTWIMWALLSAVFAAFTAIFAKIGLEGIDSDYATLLRTAVIIVGLGLLVTVTENGLALCAWAQESCC